MHHSKISSLLKVDHENDQNLIESCWKTCCLTLLVGRCTRSWSSFLSDPSGKEPLRQHLRQKNCSLKSEGDWTDITSGQLNTVQSDFTVHYRTSWLPGRGWSQHLAEGVVTNLCDIMRLLIYSNVGSHLFINSTLCYNRGTVCSNSRKTSMKLSHFGTSLLCSC